MRKMKPFSIKSGIRQGCLLFYFIQHSFRIPSYSNKTGKRNKRNHIGKDEIKMAIFADNLILYVKDLGNSTKKILNVANIFNKEARYK
jgi:hypothetical protein